MDENTNGDTTALAADTAGASGFAAASANGDTHTSGAALGLTQAEVDAALGRDDPGAADPLKATKDSAPLTHHGLMAALAKMADGNAAAVREGEVPLLEVNFAEDWVRLHMTVLHGDGSVTTANIPGGTPFFDNRKG